MQNAQKYRIKAYTFFKFVVSSEYFKFSFHFMCLQVKWWLQNLVTVFYKIGRDTDIPGLLLMVDTKSSEASNLGQVSKCGYSQLFLAPVTALIQTIRSQPCLLGDIFIIF